MTTKFSGEGDPRHNFFGRRSESHDPGWRIARLWSESRGSTTSALRPAGTHYGSPNLVLEPHGSKCKPAVSRIKNRLNGQRVRGPGEDSMGAGAEREWGFDPNRRPRSRSAGRVQRSKGGTGTTRTHRPAAGWPGGVLRIQRTTQPSWMCSFDDTWWHLRTWGRGRAQRAPQEIEMIPPGGGCTRAMRGASRDPGRSSCAGTCVY
jgi:hypothetical protein